MRSLLLWLSSPRFSNALVVCALLPCNRLFAGYKWEATTVAPDLGIYAVTKDATTGFPALYRFTPQGPLDRQFGDKGSLILSMISFPTTHISSLSARSDGSVYILGNGIETSEDTKGSGLRNSHFVARISPIKNENRVTTFLTTLNEDDVSWVFSIDKTGETYAASKQEGGNAITLSQMGPGGSLLRTIDVSNHSLESILPSAKYREITNIIAPGNGNLILSGIAEIKRTTQRTQRKTKELIIAPFAFRVLPSGVTLPIATQTIGPVEREMEWGASLGVAITRQDSGAIVLLTQTPDKKTLVSRYLLPDGTEDLSFSTVLIASTLGAHPDDYSSVTVLENGLVAVAGWPTSPPEQLKDDPIGAPFVVTCGDYLGQAAAK